MNWTEVIRDTNVIANPAGRRLAQRVQRRRHRCCGTRCTVAYRNRHAHQCTNSNANRHFNCAPNRNCYRCANIHPYRQTYPNPNPNRNACAYPAAYRRPHTGTVGHSGH